MIKVICVGKIKEKFFSDAVDEYVKRLNRYTKIEIIELQDYDFSDNKKVLEKEKESILKNIKEKDYLVTLEIDGQMLTSEELSIKIDNLTMNEANLVFVIGGSFGLHDDIKNLSKLKLSFSKMTFPHQLFRAILLEQIYRSYKIMKKETYHK